MQAGVDLFDQARLGFDSDLLVASLLQALDFEVQSGILAVNRAQDFPIVEGIAERRLLFVKVGPGDDRVDQVALVLHQPQRALKVGFAGMQIQRFFRMFTRLSRSGSASTCRSTEAMNAESSCRCLLLDVVFQRLENGIVRILDQISLDRRPCALPKLRSARCLRASA